MTRHHDFGVVIYLFTIKTWKWFSFIDQIAAIRMQWTRMPPIFKREDFKFLAVLLNPWVNRIPYNASTPSSSNKRSTSWCWIKPWSFILMQLDTHWRTGAGEWNASLKAENENPNIQLTSSSKSIERNTFSTQLVPSKPVLQPQWPDKWASITVNINFNLEATAVCEANRLSYPECEWKQTKEVENL